MKFHNVGLALVLLTALIGGPSTPSCRADLITPEQAEFRNRTDALRESTMAARNTGTFAQQIAAATEWEKLSARAYHPYGREMLEAKMALAEIYWSNGKPLDAERTLTTFLAGFDKEYSAAIKRLNGADPMTDRAFLRSGPGTVGDKQLDLLVYLSDLSQSLGKTKESTAFMQRAARYFKDDKNKDPSRSWADVLESLRLEHPAARKAKPKVSAQK